MNFFSTYEFTFSCKIYIFDILISIYSFCVSYFYEILSNITNRWDHTPIINCLPGHLKWTQKLLGNFCNHFKRLLYLVYTKLNISKLLLCEWFSVSISKESKIPIQTLPH